MPIGIFEAVTLGFKGGSVDSSSVDEGNNNIWLNSLMMMAVMSGVILSNLRFAVTSWKSSCQ